MDRVVRSEGVQLVDAELCGGLLPGRLTSALDWLAAQPETARLPAAMVPARWLPVAHLPRTPGGKIDRAAIRAASTRTRFGLR